MSDVIKRCRTCKKRNADGYCQSNKIQEDYDNPPEERKDMLLYSYTEGGSFWVGKDFGCVHHVDK